MPVQRPVLTREGRERLQHELDELLTHKRPEVRERLREALEDSHGDTADQAQYHHLQFDQARIEQRIAELERLLAEAEMVDVQAGRGYATIGSSVLVRGDEGDERFTLVGSAESAPGHGRISVDSPVGRALLGRQVGEIVEFDTPAGRERLEVLAVE